MELEPVWVAAGYTPAGLAEELDDSAQAGAAVPVEPAAEPACSVADCSEERVALRLVVCSAAPGQSPACFPAGFGADWAAQVACLAGLAADNWADSAEPAVQD